MLHDYQMLSTFDQVERQFLMQDRHDSDLTESVMLGPPLQIIWVMENLHDKSSTFAVDICFRAASCSFFSASRPRPMGGGHWKRPATTG